MTKDADGIKILTDKERAELEKVQPMWKIVASQFLNHKAAVVGLVIINLFLLIALSAPLIQMVTGLDPEAQNPLNRYQKMFTRTQMPNDQKEDLITRFKTENPEAFQVIGQELVTKQLVTDPSVEEAVYELIKKEPADFNNILSQLQTPEKSAIIKMQEKFETFHLFGTDELGRDVFIRLIFGTRVSMGVGILVALSSTLIGLFVGAIAGYYGGIIDNALMRVTDSLLSLPILPIQIVIAAVDLSKVPFFNRFVGAQHESMYKLIFILVIFSWMTTALLVRGSILSLREREFILAAKTLGAKDSTIIFRHIFPNVVAPLLVSVTLGVGESILFEAALSFLGLGIQQPTPSWGNMLNNAQDLISEAPFLAILPGLLILATTMSFNYLGDGLQDAIDPKAVRR